MITLAINGQQHRLSVAPETPLLWVIRDTLGLTGTKYSCGIGACGACTVHADGIAIRACLTPVASVQSKKVTTIEGLSSGQLHPLQQAWVATNAPQCGYCQSGQIMAAAALLLRVSSPTPAQIDAAMAGNLCRCASYIQIRAAILHVCAQGPSDASAKS